MDPLVPMWPSDTDRNLASTTWHTVPCCLDPLEAFHPHSRKLKGTLKVTGEWDKSRGTGKLALPNRAASPLFVHSHKPQQTGLLRHVETSPMMIIAEIAIKILHHPPGTTANTAYPTQHPGTSLQDEIFTMKADL